MVLRTLRVLAVGAFTFAGLAASTAIPTASIVNAATTGITVTPNAGGTALTPQLPDCPKLVIPGAKPSVKGSGFSSTSTVTLTFDGKKVGTAKTNSKGAFTTTFVVPGAVYGTHTVVAKDSHGISATQLVRVGGYTCFSSTGTTSLTVKWGVGGVDPHTASSIVFNNATVHNATTNASGGISLTFTTSCQHGSTTWVVHVIQGGQPATAQGTFTPAC